VSTLRCRCLSCAPELRLVATSIVSGHTGRVCRGVVCVRVSTTLWSCNACMHSSFSHFQDVFLTQLLAVVCCVRPVVPLCPGMTTTTPQRASTSHDAPSVNVDQASPHTTTTPNRACLPTPCCVVVLWLVFQRMRGPLLNPRYGLLPTALRCRRRRHRRRCHPPPPLTPNELIVHVVSSSFRVLARDRSYGFLYIYIFSSFCTCCLE